MSLGELGIDPYGAGVAELVKKQANHCMPVSTYPVRSVERGTTTSKGPCSCFTSITNQGDSVNVGVYPSGIKVSVGTLLWYNDSRWIHRQCTKCPWTSYPINTHSIVIVSF